MASLKEIKGRIASVSSTLKITSAMKLVASAKLRKAQNAIGNMNLYQQGLQRILMDLTGGAPLSYGSSSDAPSSVALVCFSSNSSLCGAFNANVIREALKAVKQYEKDDVPLTVYSIGRKMADAMRKAGHPSPVDYTKLSAHPNYAEISALAQELIDGFSEGRFSRVELIYNHFKSTASQPTVRETYLPMGETVLTVTPDPTRPEVLPDSWHGEDAPEDTFIIEPDRQTQIDLLLPKVLRLKVYTVLLDTVAAEHAARTVAMQTATDNGNDLLQQLTLEYNKSRQAKITAEILDLEGGSLE